MCIRDSLERDLLARAFGRLHDLLAVGGHERLVGRDHVLARGERLEDHVARHRGAADAVSYTHLNTPLQIEIGLLQTATHDSKNVSEQHLDAFYTTFDEIKDQHFDGMIITGAPVMLSLIHI